MDKSIKIRDFWFSAYKILNYNGYNIEIVNLKIDLENYFKTVDKQLKSILFSYMEGYTQKELCIKYKTDRFTLHRFLIKYKTAIIDFLKK